MKIDRRITARSLSPAIERFLELSARKITAIHKSWDPDKGTPVFTVRGRYTTRGWTEWTQGFQYGCAILQYDMTGEERFLELGRNSTVTHMAPHVSHIGVHDHGFNNLSTYGNLRRLMLEGRVEFDQKELDFYELAIKVSGAVQAARWTETAAGTGFIHSFNGPHSLFSDTMRSLRILVLADKLGHALMSEGDRTISLLGRAIEHALTTARFNVYYGEGRDAFDVAGRVAHESIFNTKDGNYRCASSQQGYGPFSTWTRWSARFYGYWRRRESSPSIDLGQRLATHATGGAGAGGQLAGCHGASRAPRAGSGATGREDRVAGNGVGAPKRTGQWRRQGIVVGVGLSRLASLRQASIFGSVAGRSAGSRRPRSLVGVGGAGGRVGADQAEHVPPMRSGVVRRRSPSAASPGGRDTSGASPGHRVSVPYLALPALLHSDRSALAGGCVVSGLGCGW